LQRELRLRRQRRWHLPHELLHLRSKRALPSCDERINRTLPARYHRLSRSDELRLV
jgi:hypothetical protein